MRYLRSPPISPSAVWAAKVAPSLTSSGGVGVWAAATNSLFLVLLKLGSLHELIEGLNHAETMNAMIRKLMIARRTKVKCRLGTRNDETETSVPAGSTINGVDDNRLGRPAVNAP